MKKIFFTVLFIALIGYFAFALYSYGEERKNEIIIDVAEAVLDGTNEDRYQNMLIYYDTEFDRNEYGYELLVDAGNGFVIGKGDKVVLSDGTYILSGHGSAADFLRDVEFGDIVDILEGRVVV